MNHNRYARRTASFVIAVWSTLFGILFFAPSAFAFIVPSPGGPPPAVSPRLHPIAVHTVVVGGMAGWQVTLITVGAALFTATVAVLADRARAARRRLTMSAA
jgi:hypothetical protein